MRNVCPAESVMRMQMACPLPWRASNAIDRAQIGDFGVTVMPMPCPPSVKS